MNFHYEGRKPQPARVPSEPLKDNDKVAAYSFRTGGTVEFRVRFDTVQQFFAMDGYNPERIPAADRLKRDKRRASAIIALHHASGSWK